MRDSKLSFALSLNRAWDKRVKTKKPPIRRPRVLKKPPVVEDKGGAVKIKLVCPRIASTLIGIRKYKGTFLITKTNPHISSGAILPMLGLGLAF